MRFQIEERKQSSTMPSKGFNELSRSNDLEEIYAKL